MTDADDIKAQVDITLSMHERAVSHLTHLDEAIDQLQGQILLLGLEGSRDSRVRSVTTLIGKAKQELLQIEVDLFEIRARLFEWRMKP